VPRHPTEGIPLHEHELTLSVAYKLKWLLESEGAQVCVTRRPRDEGGTMYLEPYDYTGDGRVRGRGAAVEDEPERLQPRIDIVNGFGAEVLLSIHFNGSEDQRVRGSEIYFTDGGPDPEGGRHLASTVLGGLLDKLAAAGHRTTNRGVLSDNYQRYPPSDMSRLLNNNARVIRANGYDPAACRECYRLLTLGNNPMSLHRGNYLGVLVEVEFLSNPDVVDGFMLRPDSLDVIAWGLFQGLRSYFESAPAPAR
jgi:N-acetylmuramoyl-L-alanine amidase